MSKLRGADVTLPDIRAGFSAVLAAAVAEGTSTLRGVNHIERGYHRPFEQFASLGLKITRLDRGGGPAPALLVTAWRRRTGWPGGAAPGRGRARAAACVFCLWLARLGCTCHRTTEGGECSEVAHEQQD